MFKNIDILNNIKIRFVIVAVLLAISFFFIRHYRIFQPAAIVLAPNGGEMFEYGQAMQIRWTPGTPGIRLIEFVPVSGGSPIAAYNAAPFSYTVADTSGSHSLILYERIPGGSYYVRVYTANSYEFDQSDGSIQIIEKEFSKTKAPSPSVPIPTPSTPTPSQIPSILPLPSLPTPCVELWSCGGWTSCVNSAQTIICTDANNCGTTNARPALSRSCTSPLPEIIPTLTVRSPNGGENFYQGTSMNIVWTAKNAPSYMRVNIYLFTRNPAENKDYGWTTNIISQTGNDGEETWTISKGIPLGTDYFIRLSCDYPQGTQNFGCKADDSDKAFSISTKASPSQKQLEQLPSLEQLPPSVQETVQETVQEKITPPVQKPVEHKSLMGRTWSRVINVFKSFFGI